MTRFPDRAAWEVALASDPALGAWAGAWSFDFAVASGAEVVAGFAFRDGRPAGAGAAAAVTLAADPAAWSHFLAPVPPRHHHNYFAMLARVPGTAVLGDVLAFYQHAHVIRRVLEIARRLVSGPAAERASAGPDPLPPATGAYVRARAGGSEHVLYYETAGAGRDLLCLHTAGADSRQFHRLMADPRLTAGHRLVAFDLPWHGRSPASGVAGSWRLDTELYVALIMGFIAAAGLRRPIVLGASMSGEICLELALRHPDAFGAIIACEACERVPGRFTAWPSDPRVNQGYFIPEWIHGLSAPQSPAECVAAIDWHYAQSGPGVFTGDIGFYAGEWDARERVGRIDGARAGLHMLTGEYDYSCTVEMSAATAAKIPGVRFAAMPGIGHFPFAENPALFAQHLLPILEERSHDRDHA